MHLFRLSALPLGLLVLLLSLGGCDLFSEEDTVIRASGTVILAETGEPLSGLSVALDSDAGGPGARRVETTVRTDVNGTFSLIYDAGSFDHFVYSVLVNDNPIDERYTSRSVIVQPGEPRNLGVIELSRIED